MDSVKAKKVGGAFLRHFYKVFLETPEKLAELFGETSSFTTTDEHNCYFGDPMSFQVSARGQEELRSALEHMNLENSSIAISMYETQAVPPSSVLLVVVGFWSQQGGPFRRFNHSFILSCPSESVIYVENAIFMVLSDDVGHEEVTQRGQKKPVVPRSSASAASSAPAAPAPASAPAAPAAPAPAAVAEQAAPEAAPEKSQEQPVRPPSPVPAPAQQPEEEKEVAPAPEKQAPPAPAPSSAPADSAPVAVENTNGAPGDQPQASEGGEKKTFSYAAAAGRPAVVRARPVPAAPAARPAAEKGAAASNGSAAAPRTHSPAPQRDPPSVCVKNIGELNADQLREMFGGFGADVVNVKLPIPKPSQLPYGFVSFESDSTVEVILQRHAENPFLGLDGNPITVELGKKRENRNAGSRGGRGGRGGGRGGVGRGGRGGRGGERAGGERGERVERAGSERPRR